MDRWVSLGVTLVLDEIARGNTNAKWRRALLKIFREIARQFKTDKEFLDVAKQEFK